MSATFSYESEWSIFVSASTSFSSSASSSTASSSLSEASSAFSSRLSASTGSASAKVASAAFAVSCCWRISPKAKFWPNRVYPGAVAAASRALLFAAIASTASGTSLKWNPAKTLQIALVMIFSFSSSGSPCVLTEFILDLAR